MENVRKRIRQVLAKKHVSVNSLAVENGVNQGVLNNQINASTNISVNTILLVLNRIPNLSAEWLLRGTGSMFMSAAAQDTEPQPNIEELQTLIRRQQREIDGLYERIEELKQ